MWQVSRIFKNRGDLRTVLIYKNSSITVLIYTLGSQCANQNRRGELVEALSAYARGRLSATLPSEKDISLLLSVSENSANKINVNERKIAAGELVHRNAHGQNFCWL